MRISAGSVLLLASLALTSSAKEAVPVHRHPFASKFHFSETRCSNRRGHATTMQSSIARLSFDGLPETTPCDGVNEIMQEPHTAPPYSHKVRFENFRAALKDALSRTATILSKSFKICNKKSMRSPVIPSTPPNTPVVSPLELTNGGTSGIVPLSCEIPSTPSFCYHDGSASPVWSPSISTYMRPESSPSSTTHDMETTTDLLAYIFPSPSLPVQPPNSPMFLSTAAAHSFTQFNISSSLDTHPPHFQAAEDEDCFPEPELIPSTFEETDSRFTLPLLYLSDAPRSPAVGFSSTGRQHTVFNARQLAYLDMCLKYVQD